MSINQGVGTVVVVVAVAISVLYVELRLHALSAPHSPESSAPAQPTAPAQPAPPAPLSILERGLRNGEINEFIATKQSDIAGCAALMRDSAVHGTVEMRFDIEKTGEVPRVWEGNSSAMNTPMARCLGEAMQRWEFPRHGGRNTGSHYRVFEY